MKAIIYSMILLCSVPINATWDFSWESVKSYIPSIELPPIKPYLGWIFGASCLAASIVCIALIKNNTKYEVQQAEQNGVTKFVKALESQGQVFMHKNDKGEVIKIDINAFSFDYITGLTSFLCTAPEINRFNMNINDQKGAKYSFLEVARKEHGFTKCVIDKLVFDSYNCRTQYRLSIRIRDEDCYYQFKKNLTIQNLIDSDLLEKAMS